MNISSSLNVFWIICREEVNTIVNKKYILVNNDHKKKKERSQLLTMPKYLLLLRMSSFFLTFFISAISFGSNKASSMAEAMWHSMPPLKSLIDASSRRGSPLCIGVGNHACGSES